MLVHDFIKHLLCLTLSWAALLLLREHQTLENHGGCKEASGLIRRGFEDREGTGLWAVTLLHR